MSVHEMRNPSGDVRWRVKWRDELGAQHSKVCSTRREADDLDRDIKQAKSKGTRAPVSDRRAMRFDQLSTLWLDNRVMTDLTPSTQQLYARMWDNYLSSLARFRVQDFTRNPIILVEWRTRVIREGIGPAAFEKCTTILSGIFSMGVTKLKIIETNPAKLIEPMKVDRDEFVKALSPEVVEAIRVQFTKPQSRAIVSLMGWVGMRPGEVQRLRWTDISDGSVRIEKTKTSKRRTAPLPAIVYAELMELPRVNEYVLGKVWAAADWKNWQQRTFTRAVELAAQQVQFEHEQTVPYHLRHSSISARLRSLPDDPRFPSQPFLVYRDHGNSAKSGERYSHIVEAARHTNGVALEEQLRAARLAAELRGPVPRKGHARIPRIAA